MIKPSRTRTRIRRPEWQWTGLDAIAWRSDADNLTWAQHDPHYRALLTVLLNERHRVIGPNAGTENRMLGRVEGFEIALDVLRSLATAPPRPSAIIELTYPLDNDPPDNVRID